MTPLPWWEPSCLAAALARCFGQEGLVWLDGDGSPLGRRGLLAVAPQQRLRCDGLPGDGGSRDPFEALQELSQDRRGNSAQRLHHDQVAMKTRCFHISVPLHFQGRMVQCRQRAAGLVRLNR